MKNSETSLVFVLECLCQLAISPECTREDVAKKIDAFYRGKDVNDYDNEHGHGMSFLPTTDFEIQCRGRDASGKEILEQAITQKVHVTLMENGKSLHASTSDCPYAFGSHGGYCSAKSRGDNALCPYSIQMPYMLDNCNVVPREAMNDARFMELTARLVAPGSTDGRFSASEYHELHDYIVALKDNED